MAELSVEVAPTQGTPGGAQLRPVSGGTLHVVNALAMDKAAQSAVDQANPGALGTGALEAAITPPSAGFETDAFVGAPATPTNNMGRNVAVLLVIAAIGGGLWFFQRRKQKGEN